MEFEGLAAALRNDLIGREEGAISGLKMLENLRVFFGGVHSIQRNQFHWVVFIHIILYVHYTLFLFHFPPLLLPFFLSLQFPQMSPFCFHDT